MKKNLKQITGYDHYYISENGDVYSTKKGRKTKLKPLRNNFGYFVVGLYESRPGGKVKFEMVHRLVYQMFVNNGERLDSVTKITHDNKDRTDNRVSNLSISLNAGFGDTSRNRHKHSDKHGRSKLTDDQVIELLTSFNGVHGEQKQWADKFNVSLTTIGSIVNGLSWQRINYFP